MTATPPAIASIMRQAAVHIHSLAESDHDAGHFDADLLRMALHWKKARMPGHRLMAEVVAMLAPKEKRA